MRMKKTLCFMLTAALLMGSWAMGEETAAPTSAPTPEVTVTSEPTAAPTAEPPAAEKTTVAPTEPPAPTPAPVVTATPMPTTAPTDAPTATPAPTTVPTTEPTATPAPTADPASEATETSEPTQPATAPPTAVATDTPTAATNEPPTPAPSVIPAPQATATDMPTAAPSPEPPQEKPFIPTQDAWTQFSDQAYVEGTVETVLKEAQKRKEHPAIFVRTDKQVTVTNVAQSYIECLTPDPDVFTDGENGSDYRVIYEIGTPTNEGALPPVTLRVVDMHRMSDKTPAPTETPVTPKTTPDSMAAEPSPTPTITAALTMPPATEPTPSSTVTEKTPMPTITAAITMPPAETEPPQADEQQEQAETVGDVQAWARYAAGSLVQGTVQDVLDSIGFDETAMGELPTVYIRTQEKVRLENIAEPFMQRLTLRPDADVFAQSGEVIVKWKLLEDQARGLPPIELWVEAVPQPTPTPQPTPVPTISVTPLEYRPGEWSNIAPTFELAGIEEGSTDYVYGVFICNEQLIVFSRDTTAYTPNLEGADIRVRFAILDMMGDVLSFSDEYAMMLDMTPPDGPYPMPYDAKNTIAQVYASDSMSGLQAISLDGGKSWLDAELPEDQFRCEGKKGETIPPEQLQARDFAGNISKCYEEYAFGPERKPGSGDGKKPIQHVTQTLDYSHANYNALELLFPDEPQTQLVAGDEMLNLSLTVDGEQGAFMAQMHTYPTEEGIMPPAENALILTAQAAEDAACAWVFTGDVYRLLYNSRIDYLVLRTGDYITVLPTAGFTAGTEYVRLKSNGISTRKFTYTVTQDEAMLETTLIVAVENATYELGEERSMPMYRTGVLIGPMSLLEKPYNSYLHSNNP